MIEAQSLVDIKPLASSSNITTKIQAYHSDLAHIQPRLISDVDAQSIIASMTDDFESYFHENLSDGYSIEALQLHFGEKVRDSIGDQHGQILCSHNVIQERKRIDQALSMRKINSRATPIARDTINGGWHKHYALPAFMAFDVDANKNQIPLAAIASTFMR